MTDDREPVPVRHAYIGGNIPREMKANVQRITAQLGMDMRDAIEEGLAMWLAKHGDDDE